MAKRATRKKQKKKRKKRGGAQPNAGRPALDPGCRMISTSFALSRELLARIDKAAHREEMDRSKLIRKFVEECLVRREKTTKPVVTQQAVPKAPPALPTVPVARPIPTSVADLQQEGTGECQTDTMK